MPRIVSPVIVVPGITATYLEDRYPLPPETIWAVLPSSKLFDRVSLHPDDVRFEASGPSLVRPGQIYEVAYRELVEELKDGLSDDTDAPVPVYTFGYDWRKPLSVLSAELGAFVDEVIERTSLLRHYHKAGYHEAPTVNLVGHSMGGLLITGYAAEAGAESCIDRVVTLATPYQGSLESIVKITMGVGTLGTNQPGHRERKAARVTPSLYHLLPNFERGIEFDDDLPASLFDPLAWQPSVVETIADYVYEHSTVRLTKTAARKAAATLFSKLLDEARHFMKTVSGFDLASAGLDESRWLPIVGVGTKTRVHIRIEAHRGRPQFRFDEDADLDDRWGRGDAANQRRTGDGTVPYEGAVAPFLPEANLVLVTPDDFEFWELKDKALTGVGGFHGILPNMNMLQRLVIRYLRGDPDRYDNTWGRKAPGVDAWRGHELFRLQERSR